MSDFFASVDLSQATIRSQDREGILCPWEKSLIWEYKDKEGVWKVDQSIVVNCSNILHD